MVSFKSKISTLLVEVETNILFLSITISVTPPVASYIVVGIKSIALTFIVKSKDTKKRKLPFSLDGRIRLNEGYLLEDQLNLMLQFMPVDLTYVDENDIVLFYNRGENRVFPRSAGIIGREVKFCHPPKSVDQVLMILKEFKAGRRDEAEFWINFKGKFIHIQYFAIRDEDGTYRGVIEMSQDVTHIRNLTGEQRLLDWE